MFAFLTFKVPGLSNNFYNKFSNQYEPAKGHRWYSTFSLSVRVVYEHSASVGAHDPWLLCVCFAFTMNGVV